MAFVALAEPAELAALDAFRGGILVFNQIDTTRKSLLGSKILSTLLVAKNVVLAHLVPVYTLWSKESTDGSVALPECTAD